MAITESEAQKKILYLLVNHQQLIAEFVTMEIGPEYFEQQFVPLVHAIEESYRNNNRFTEEYFLDFIARSVGNGNYKKWTGNDVESKIVAHGNERRIFQLVTRLDKVDPDDFQLVCRKVRENYVKIQTGELLKKFHTNERSDYFSAVSNLSENLSLLVSSSSDGNASTWGTIDEFADEWYTKLENEIVNPKSVLPTGIKPFDETMPMGLGIGHLTLIVADVGGFKSATMINMGINICKLSKENVLYVSLEMPKDMLMQRIVSREAEVDSEKISKPTLLNVDEKLKVKKAANSFKMISSKFAIIDAQERMTVSKIKAELEKRKLFFKPRVVIIDYISILNPESWYQKLAEHSWYGQMCKDLRSLGRKMGFSVVSAVQLNREAIKSLRNQKDGKQTVGSDALRGSHDFSADADNIYVQFPHPDQPKEKLYLFCVKSRYGSTMFGQFKNQTKATLDVIPNIGKIQAADEAKIWASSNSPELSEFIKKGDEASIPSNPDLDLSFDPTPPPAPIGKKSKTPQMSDDMGF